MNDNCLSKSRPRLVFTLVHLGVGGAQKIASMVMNELVAAGFDVAVICYHRAQEKVNLDDRVARFFLYERASEYKRLGFSRVVSKAHTVRRFAYYIRQLNPDCVVSFGPDALIYPALRMTRYRGKLVCCERGDASKRNRLYGLLLRMEMSSADCGVFQFDDAMAPYRGSLSRDTRVIPNPCVPAVSEQRKISNVGNEIVAAGRLVPDKGFATLIHAFSLLDDRHGASLCIYGEGPDRGRLEALVSDFGLSEKVYLPGAVTNISERALHSRLFVLSSEYEGCPNTLIEMMCAGIPVVSTDCSPGGARFLMEDGKIGGVLVPVGDAFAMARAISNMLDNQGEAERLGACGKSLAQKYPLDSIMHMWVDLFFELLGNPNCEGRK